MVTDNSSLAMLFPNFLRPGVSLKELQGVRKAVENKILTWPDQVREVSSHIVSKYFRTSNILFWGLDQMFQNKARTS